MKKVIIKIYYLSYTEHHIHDPPSLIPWKQKHIETSKVERALCLQEIVLEKSTKDKNYFRSLPLDSIDVVISVLGDLMTSQSGLFGANMNEFRRKPAWFSTIETRTSVELPIAIAGTLARPISVSVDFMGLDSGLGGMSRGSERDSRSKFGRYLGWRGSMSTLPVVAGRGCKGRTGEIDDTGKGSESCRKL